VSFLFSLVSGSNQYWFSLPSSCDEEAKIKTALDIRGKTESNLFIGITDPKIGGMAQLFEYLSVHLDIKCQKMQILGAATSGARGVILPFNTPVPSDTNVVFSSEKEGWILVESGADFTSLMQIVPAKTEPEFLSDHKMIPVNVKSPLSIKKTNPEIIAELVADVSTDVMISFLEDFTALYTRLSTAQAAALEAAQFVSESYSERGVNNSFWTYNVPANYPPNVIARIQGRTNRLVILGAHFDDRAQNINDQNARAPGANDDGSGTAALLETARVLAASGYTFEHTIEFCSFSGEEQGLYGSTAYANDKARQGADIVAMIQSDMIAHRFPQNPNRMELATRYADESLNQEVQAISSQYVPTLQVGRTTACCSDQQPFYNNGYYATALVEAGGYTVDPQYHTTTDVMYRDDYSFDQLTLITQVLVATAATFAEIAV